MDMQVGDARLRHRNHALLFRLFAEVARDQSLDYIAFQVFLEALLDDGGRHVSGAKTGEPRHLLVLLNDFFELASDFFGGNFDRNLAFDAVLLRVDCFCRTHVYPFSLPVASGLSGVLERPSQLFSHAVNLECKE